MTGDDCSDISSILDILRLLSTQVIGNTTPISAITLILSPSKQNYDVDIAISRYENQVVILNKDDSAANKESIPHKTE
jgi:hypothetical protein